MRPTILLAFANDRHGPAAGYLRQLVAECRALRALYEPAADRRGFALVVEQNLTRERLATLIAHVGERLVGLHFGGHADSVGLHVEDAAGRPESLSAAALADALGRLPRLRWLVLNGCMTRGHVDILHRRVAVPVVATSRAVGDDEARGFAARFHGAILRGDTLERAFATAVPASDRRAPDRPRFLRPAGAPATSDPWMLAAAPGDPNGVAWTLDDELAASGLAARLEPPAPRPAPRHALPSQRLTARHGLVPFAGRADELAALDRWAADGSAVRVRLIHGPGGIGKTRLVLHWLASREVEGPRGMLDGPLDAEAIELLASARCAWVGIDYAEARPGLPALLERLARRRAAGEPGTLRVVLIARHAGDWWRLLGQQSALVDDLLRDSPDPLALRALVPPGARRDEYHRAWRAFVAPDAPDAPPAIDLSDPRFARPLYLHMAALSAASGLPVHADGLLDGLLHHEARIWARVAGLTGAPSASREAFTALGRALLGAASLRGGVDDRDAARRLAERFTSGPEWPVGVLAQLYPTRRGGVAALEPDLLAEHLVAGLLADPAWPDWAARALEGADVAEAGQAFIVLGRVERQHPERLPPVFGPLIEADLEVRAQAALTALRALGERTAHSAMGQMLARRLEAHGTEGLARRLDGLVPAETTMLREVGVWIERRLIGAMAPELMDADGFEAPRVRVLTGAADVAAQRALAAREHRLARHLAALGRFDEARAVARDAAAILRLADLVAPAPDGGELPAVLNTLAGLLAERARWRSAERLDGEAHRIASRGVAEPEDDPVGAGDRLRALARSRAESGRLREATALAEEAVRLHRACARAMPEAHGARLARSLLAQSRIDARAGRERRAHMAGEEALALLGHLETVQPDAVLADLADACRWVADLRAARDDLEGALHAAREAVRIRRALDRRRPAAHGARLADDLDALAARLDATGDPVGAAACRREAEAWGRLRPFLHPAAGEPGEPADRFAGELTATDARGWLALEWAGRRFLAYGYIDAQAGLSARGAAVSAEPTVDEIHAVIHAPDSTFRMPLGDPRRLTSDEQRALGLPRRPAWLTLYFDAGRPWHRDERIVTHPRFPDDVEALFILAAENHVERMWVRLTSAEPALDAYRGRLLNTSRVRPALAEGREVIVRPTPGAPHPVWLDEVARAHLERDRGACQACGFDLLLTPPPAAADVVAFHCRCALCGEPQFFRRLETGATPAAPRPRRST